MKIKNPLFFKTYFGRVISLFALFCIIYFYTEFLINKLLSDPVGNMADAFSALNVPFKITLVILINLLLLYILYDNIFKGFKYMNKDSFLLFIGFIITLVLFSHALVFFG